MIFKEIVKNMRNVIMVIVIGVLGTIGIIGLSSCTTMKGNKKNITNTNDTLDSKTPFLTSPKVRKVWVPEKIEGEKFIEGHWMWVLERTSSWSQ
jgi:hypothetical protein